MLVILELVEARTSGRKQHNVTVLRASRGGRHSF
jgi:hypothetical protein